MQYQLKNLDRCDSQQLKEVQIVQNTTYNKTENPANVKLGIDELLSKIQAINNNIENDNKKLSEGYEKCIVKQGKQSDEPHQPSVLTWSRMKNNNRILENYSDIPIKQRSFVKIQEKNTQKSSQDFYKYCKDEIVRVSKQNSSICKKLQKVSQELENQRRINQILKKENSKMIKQLQEWRSNYTRSNQQVILLRQQISDLERANIYKYKSQISLLAEKTKIYEEELNKYRKMINEKDENNLRLVNQIKNLKLQSVKLFQLREENTRLGKKVSELIGFNKILQEKAAGKSQSVDHLWSIKEIQYANIMRLISLSKTKNLQQ